MAKRWQMLRCECGQSFGASVGGSPSCARCGSSRVRRVGLYEDASELSKAVALANAPKEVQQEILVLLGGRLWLMLMVHLFQLEEVHFQAKTQVK